MCNCARQKAGALMNSQSQTRTAVFVLAASISTASHAEDKTGHVSAQELKAKTAYCKTCHGIDGQGFRGSYPMPRLAGQQPEYIENQLKAFIERRVFRPRSQDDDW
jgi:cytochrome c553